ncbi:MAG TPA: nuclear transport factor 2 family protein [Caulobacteraceae bacterium]|jgi:ketosteroid isomerase-like protein
MLRYALAALLLTAPAIARADPAADTAAAVRAADTAFEARAQVAGTAQAFREYMDPKDGLEFDPGAPIRGAEAIYQSLGGAKQSTSKLEWTVVDAWGAASGDLGVTTGTWKASSLAHPEAPAATGRYVTVWRKDAAGRWKGLIDIGTDDPPPAAAAAKP